MTDREIHVHAEVAGWFKWAACGLIGTCAVFFIVGALDRFSPTRVAEAGGLMLVGLALAFLAWRVWRYYTQPALSLTENELIRRPFWRKERRWRLNDIKRLVGETETITRSGGKRLPVPVTVQRLTVISNADQSNRFVLVRVAPATLDAQRRPYRVAGPSSRVMRPSHSVICWRKRNRSAYLPDCRRLHT